MCLKLREGRDPHRVAAGDRALALVADIGVTSEGMSTKDVLGGWREQYDRMRRTLHRFLDTYNPAVDAIERRRGLGSVSQAELEMQDAFIHFVQDAWHLKDWLKSDPATSSLREIVERDIPQGGYLRMCQDLANATKHLAERKSDTGLGQQPRYGWLVISKDHEIDPLQFAMEVVKSWDSWLREHHLI